MIQIKNAQALGLREAEYILKGGGLAEQLQDGLRYCICLA